MAVLRPDQAQLTFSAETAYGADLESIGIATISGSSTTFHSEYRTGGAGTELFPSGSSNVHVTTLQADWKIGDFLHIGYSTTHGTSQPTIPESTATKSIIQSEIRRMEHIEADASGNGGRVWFDRPTSFTHHGSDGGTGNDSAAYINHVAKVASRDETASRLMKAISYVPGVYETVDTPDPQMAMEPRYLLGTQNNRNFTTMYAGQQTFQGALSGIVLLTGWPLRWAIGQEIPVVTSGNSTVLSSITLDQTGGSKKGDFWIKASSASHGISANDYIIIGYEASPTLDSIAEIRQVTVVTGSNAWVKLNKPLLHDHPTSTTVLRKYNTTAGTYLEHHLVEKVDLSSISMHVHMRDSGGTAANDFDRRWVGGKVGAMTLMAEEGGLVTVNWDNVIFKDMFHNQPRHVGTSTGTTVNRYPATTTVLGEGLPATIPDMPGYAVMADISSGDIAFPTTQPYYFSGGTIKFFDSSLTDEFARIRNFSINVNNNEDARYYIGPRYGDHRGPSELREQRREYTMSATLALPDSGDSQGETYNTATSIFKELLLEGRYGSGQTSGNIGFVITLKFVRGTFENSNTEFEDAIYIDIPGPRPGVNTLPTPGTPSDPNNAIGQQGAFLRSAPHTLTTENPMQISCDFVFRNMHVIIRDNEPVYP